MRFERRAFILASLVCAGPVARAQVSPTFPAPLPTTASAVGAWDVVIVQRAAAILSSPAQWDRAHHGDCLANAKTFSIICALGKAVEEAVGIHRDQQPATPAITRPAAFSDCRFHPAKDGREGSCGVLFDEAPIFTISPVKAVTSGTWRTGVHPTEVWAGTMADAEQPVLYEARELVNVVTTKKYPGRLIGYNNDSATTFANVREFFTLLQAQVLEHGAADLSQSWDSVEVEVYAGGTGVIRTYAGWYPISGFTSRDSMLRFQIDTAQEVPPSTLDRDILLRAATIITSDSVWNRADNRKCPTTATTWSIYCAVERAEVEVAGGFHHRRPAMELVRQLVDERTSGKSYQHRLMDYNNDPSTRLEDVRSLFAEAIGRIKGS